MEEPKRRRTKEHSDYEDFEAESFKNNAALFLMREDLLMQFCVANQISMARGRLMMMQYPTIVSLIYQNI
jgi:hypothetical protein